MSPDKNDSQNKPKPEKKMGIDKGELGHPDPEMRGGSLQKKIFFRPFGSQFGLQIRGARAPSLDPPLNDSQASRPAREPLGKRAKT